MFATESPVKSFPGDGFKCGAVRAVVQLFLRDVHAVIFLNHLTAFARRYKEMSPLKQKKQWTQNIASCHEVLKFIPHYDMPK